MSRSRRSRGISPGSSLSRRGFVAGAAGVAGGLALGGPAAGRAAESQPAVSGRKIRLGLVGCGGRGSWIARLFQKHGGYELYALADYFPEVAEARGNELGVDKSRRFSGLNGYKRLIDSGVEAVALETPPCFFPDHVKAAVEAGCHVYMAKPVAVDVPGALQVLESGKRATARKQCFLVDYQMPTDPVHIEIKKRILDGALGKLAHATTFGYSSGFSDPPKTATIKSRLQKLVWVNDVAIGGDNIGNYDIHALDAALWLLGGRPVAAMGQSRVARKDPHGDGRDVCQVLYEFPDGLLLSHHGQALPNSPDEGIGCKVYGQAGMAVVNYWGKSFINGGPKAFPGATIENLYEAGAVRNIAAFYNNITEGRFENETLGRAVDGVLMAVLGREAAARKTRLTMEELIKENRRVEVDVKGLKA